MYTQHTYIAINVVGTSDLSPLLQKDYYMYSVYILYICVLYCKHNRILISYPLYSENHTAECSSSSR